MGRGLYWIPKSTGAREGLNTFAGWSRGSALRGSVPSQVSQGTGPTFAPQGDPDAIWPTGLALGCCPSTTLGGRAMFWFIYNAGQP